MGEVPMTELMSYAVYQNRRSSYAALIELAEKDVKIAAFKQSTKHGTKAEVTAAHDHLQSLRDEAGGLELAWEATLDEHRQRNIDAIRADWETTVAAYDEVLVERLAGARDMDAGLTMATEAYKTTAECADKLRKILIAHHEFKRNHGWRDPDGSRGLASMRQMLFPSTPLERVIFAGKMAEAGINLSGIDFSNARFVARGNNLIKRAEQYNDSALSARNIVYLGNEEEVGQ